MFNKNDTFYKIALEKYAGKHLLDLIKKKKKDQLKLYGEAKELTISFNNIIGYTKLSDKVTPEFLIQFLYKYYEAVFYGIEKNDGVVISIAGDKIISFFGYEHSGHEIKAIKSYFDSVSKFKDFLLTVNMGHINVIGTGINSGRVILGNFGTENRIFYSILGDHVNFASRLVTTNKIFGTNIIISDFTYQKIKNEVIVRELDKIYVKGLNGPQQIYEIASLK